MRRVSLVLAVLICAAAPAAVAAPLKYHGHSILPGPLPGQRALQALDAYPRALVQLDPSRGDAAVPVLVRAGAQQLAPRLRLWRLPSRRAQRLLPSLLRAGAIRSVTPDVPLRSDAMFFDQSTDPLVGNEWWIPAIRANQVDPPGPGGPLT